MVADLGLSLGIDTFPEDTDDDEGYALDADGSADSRVHASIELFRERLHDNGDLFVCHFVLVVEEAAGDDDKIAYDSILRRDAQEHGGLGDTAADADVIMKLQHRR